MKLILACSVAFISSASLVLFLRRVALRVGLVDAPGGRKQHEGKIPLVGGLAMFSGFAFGVLLLAEPLTSYRSLIAAMALLVIIGTVDDLSGLSPFSKFIWQALAALLMTSWGGVGIVQLGDLLGMGQVQLGSWTIPFTVVCVVGVINAINMSDGLDGLAGGIALIAVGCMAVAAIMAAQVTTARVLIVFACAIAAFLVFNLRSPWRRRALVFMGDAGSMMLGFVLTWFAVQLTQGEKPVLSPIIAVWLLGLPLLDMGSVLLRRVVRGRTPFSADREHIHHILLRAGYSIGQTVAILLALAAVLAVAGLSAWALNVPDAVMFYAFLTLFGFYFIAQQHAWRLMRLLKHVPREN